MYKEPEQQNYIGNKNLESIYVLSSMLDGLKKNIQILSNIQRESKKEKSTVTNVKDLAKIQSGISYRKKIISGYHSKIETIKEKLRKYPRGEEGLKIHAKQLSEHLTHIKEMYSVETTGQHRRKKALTDGSFFTNQDEFSLTQSKKMETKLKIQNLVEERKLIKTKYKIVTDRLYNDYKLAYVA